MEESDKSKSPNADRLKLCGSARKRLKIYLQQGMEIENARVLCQKPMKEVRNELKELKTPKKRKYSHESNQDEISPPKGDVVENVSTPRTSIDGSIEANNINVELETNMSNKPHSNADEIIRLAVIPSDYPNTIWTDEKLKLIQTAVLDKIIECKKGNLKPQFAGCSYKPGWLLFKCKGHNSELWVREHVPTLKPWQDAKLKVVSEEEIPKSEIFVGYFPEKPETLTSRILSLIEGQNEDLSVEFWKVLNRISKNKIEEITFAIDPSSICKLKELGYHISYGYGTVHIRPTKRQYGVMNDAIKNEQMFGKERRTRSYDRYRYSDEDTSSAEIMNASAAKEKIHYIVRRYSQQDLYDSTISSVANEKEISHSTGTFNEDLQDYNKTSGSNNNGYVTNFSGNFKSEQDAYNKSSDARSFDTSVTNMPFTRRYNGPTPNYEDEQHDIVPAAFPNSYRATDNADWSRRY